MAAHHESKRNIAFKRLSDAVTCARNCLSDSTILPRFETWCSRLESLMETFNDSHIKLISEYRGLGKEDCIQKQTTYQEQADDMYFEILEAKRSLFPENLIEVKASTSSCDHKTEHKNQAKLPPIKLPTFSGQFKDFPGYIDLFNTLVHSRTDLTNVEKFQYLITSLSGEPINLIRAFPISDANYTSAYEALSKRYTNKRVLAFLCWEQICNLKSISTASVQSLRTLLDSYAENLSMLDSLGLPTSRWDFVLFHSLITKIDKNSREAFELSCTGSDIPQFSQLQTFLEDRCSALERSSLTNVPMVSSAPNSQRSNNQNKSYSTNKTSSLLAQTPNTLECIICKENHSLINCNNFLSKTPRERAQLARQHSLCLNCLRSNHSTSKCFSTRSCKSCNQRHNSLLHFPREPLTNPNQQTSSQVHMTTTNQANADSAEKQVITPVTTLSNVSRGLTPTFVLLATAQVQVKDCNNTYQKVRALLDPGSQSHIMSSACARRLGLTRFKCNTPMSGIGDVPANSSSRVFLELRPLDNSEISFSMDAVVLDKICGNMPTHSINLNDFQHIGNLKLADPDFHQSRPIELLIGGEIFPQILLPGKIDGGSHLATAINTVFGFILMGRTKAADPIVESSPASVNHVSLDANLDIAIQKFWDIDHVPTESKVNQAASADDLRCEDIYKSTHKRDADGRYIVQLPFRDQSLPIFNDSYNIALRRFKQLEKRLLQNPSFGDEYKAHITEYITSNQMERVSSEECQSPTAYYIPHHAVVKPSSVSTRLRVVYDASAKDKLGKSLNDTLLTGCKLQADITNIILRFRLHAIVLSADVRQMYRQIIVTQEHRDYQRILFRFSPEEPIQELRINRVTFGVSSAPFLAIRTMRQLAQDEQESYPTAAKVLQEDLYVDDVVTGCNTVEQAIQLQQELTEIMAAGGFELRKWSSNHVAVLENIPEEHKLVPDLTFDSDTHFIKVLGLAWNAHKDVFNYQVNQIPRDCTKRTMLSELARIYDPIGLLTPLTFLAKFLIQRLWLLGTSWDEPVPDDIYQTWTKYTNQLSNLQNLHIPRCITHAHASSYQIHGFCDASEAGYAAVVYLRSNINQNHHQVCLVSARSRVAPTKRRTLPRLELCGASLLADLMHYIINLFSNILNIDGVYAWSDSMIVLAWIKSNSKNFKVYVGNRIANIQRKLPTAVWKHVPGKQNPADCASRGLLPDELISHALWWSAPEWLSLPQNHWPNDTIQSSCATSNDVLCERRTTVLSNIIDLDPINNLLQKYSSLRKIQRILAYCNRFISVLRKTKYSNNFTQAELHCALMKLVKHVQHSEFQNEIKLLSAGKTLPKSFRKLNPFLDHSGVLRVGGRLSRSELDYETKHPALLPRKHRLTILIIQSVHNDNLHPGLQALQFLLLQNFWILSPRRAIHQVISGCYKCFRTRPIAFEPKMADLPKARITQLKAFQAVGCDYAGPFNITLHRYRGARTTKAYLCLFVCFATKALHLELASDMSTDAFLAALRRFIARRGRCNILHSDCGTNFKGAESQLATVMKSACESEYIEFKFNPPGAPHFGGLWEAGIKSVKTHLYRVIGTQILTYEELNTLLTQVEAVLNSRPLCSLSTDPNDVSVLTPGHFLTQAPLTALPTPDYSNIKLNRLKRWQLVQRMHQDFWARWHTEYLTSLSQRLKWTRSTDQARLGQVVIIKDEQQPPLRWRFGKIIKLYPGRDGIPRSATVETGQGVINRPLVKLCPVPDGSN